MRPEVVAFVRADARRRKHNRVGNTPTRRRCVLCQAPVIVWRTPIWQGGADMVDDMALSAMGEVIAIGQGRWTWEYIWGEMIERSVLEIRRASADRHLVLADHHCGYSSISRDTPIVLGEDTLPNLSKVDTGGPIPF